VAIIQPFIADINGLFTEKKTAMREAASAYRRILSDDEVTQFAQMFAQRFSIPRPELATDPIGKELSADGRYALYRYRIANPEMFVYRPSTLAVIHGNVSVDTSEATMSLKVSAVGKQADDVRGEAERLIVSLRNHVQSLAEQIDGFNRLLPNECRAAIEHTQAQLKARKDFESRL
jgi:hypothetical protein